jgi:uncharacterized protein YndB with AHSA1/START domain
MRAENSVTINRPVSEVFAFVADGTTAPRWRSGVFDVERVSGDGGRGTVYRQGVRGPMGQRIPADYLVTEFESDRLISFRAIAGPFRPEGSFRLEPVGDGTRVTFSLEGELTGIKKLLMGRAAAKTMRREVGTLATLKRLQEGGSGPDPGQA